METLEQILMRNAKDYPLMQPQDAVKLIYQNVFGGGHLVKDPASCRCALQHELETTPHDPDCPVVENIGNGLARVNLAGIRTSGYSVLQLGYDFVNSSRKHTGNLSGFLLKLDILRRVTEKGVFCFSAEDLEDYLTEYEKADYPMVSHSEIYRKNYKPAYRIVMQSLLPEYLQKQNKRI